MYNVTELFHSLVCSSFNKENVSACFAHIDDSRLQVLNELLISKGRDQLENGAVINTLTRMSLNGFIIHSRSTSKAKGKLLHN